MVVGLDIFREHFAGHADAFVLIGGTACSICMEAQGLTFRATKDLDIVLMLEALDRSFFEHFWSFIRAGGYTIEERSEGNPIFFRFAKPADKRFPAQIELFSSRPENVFVPAGHTLTRILAAAGLSSLSAILLDETYYRYIASTRRTIDGLSVTPPKTLIPLKARAYLDLAKRKREGEPIDEKNVKKHKNDVFRVLQLLTDEDRGAVPMIVTEDLIAFLSAVANDPPDFKNLDIKNVTFEEACHRIHDIFQLGN